MAANSSDSQYGTKAHNLMQAARDLRNLGAQAFFDIPRIAVIGGQSAGKSSLVEAVSGIKVPRDSGTCTRCPMECNMHSEEGPWKCQISLRFEYDSTGKRLPETLLVNFGPPIDNQSLVEDALRRAQAAILSHATENSASFLGMSREDLNYYRSPTAFENGVQKFSKNVVCVDIFDPGCADLSFVDLPGLIQNEERETVDLVEDLVKTNIQGNCLILVTIPMSDDMENQRAVRMAHESDKEKERTIGVLTKPDTLTSGAVSARSTWKEIITGEHQVASRRLKLGFYCVKLSDDVERSKNPSRDNRESTEMHFFTSNEPWNEIANDGRFGVRNLVTNLSKHLAALLEIILPGFLKEALKLLAENKAALDLLPKPVEVDATSEILGRINEYCRELNRIVKAEESKQFVQANIKLYKAFKMRIRATAPDFRPFEDAELYVDPNLKVESDDDSGGTESESDAPSMANGVVTVGPHDLTYVREVIRDSIGWELPNNIPFDAKKFLINEFLEKWPTPAFKCFNSVADNLEEALDDLASKHFSRFPSLEVFMRNSILSCLQAQREKAHSTVEDVLALESGPYFTLNFGYWNNAKNKWLSQYRNTFNARSDYLISNEESDDGRYSRVSKASSPRIYPCAPSYERELTPLEKALYALKALGYKVESAADLVVLDPKLRKSQFEDELVVMADVRTFFQICFKRICDHLPLTIEHHLNQAVATSLQSSLWKSLDLESKDASTRLKELLAEDPEIVAKRKLITSRIGQLEEVIEKLRSLS